jgi:sugar phosphate isomerase/epimerase
VEPWQPAYDEDPAAFRRKIDRAGLRCFGFHMPLPSASAEWDRFVDIAVRLGARLMIPAWIGPERRGRDAAGWRAVGAALREGRARAAGVTVAWHNHDFEYALLADGSRPIDHLLAEAGDNVGFEIDCGWVVRGHADPAAELARYAPRIVAIQVKDTAPLGTLQDGGWTATGDGIIDWSRLWPHFRKTRADHLVVERDNPADWRVFARRSFACVQSLMERARVA